MVVELKKIADCCREQYGLDKCLPISWLDGSNTKTRKYLWAQMKYSSYSESPVSVSLFVEKNGEQARFRISLEIKNDGTDKAAMAKYHIHLELPKKANMAYVSGSNEWGNPVVIPDSQEIIRNKVAAGEIKKVQLCVYIDPKPDQTNEFYHQQVMSAVGDLIPYYEYVLGTPKAPTPPAYRPTLQEYEPQILKETYDKNIILYGPPGTGKTYSTGLYAVAICDGLALGDVEALDYEAVMRRYGELTAAGRIAFTTFHQSYGYEEFIEGIRPNLDRESKELSYSIEPGVFKKFCAAAEKRVVLSETDLPDVSSARVWCVLLDGAGVSGLKQDCFANQTIRIGWDQCPEIITGETEGLNGKERRILLNFQDEMEIGDVVVTERSNKTIDGIGIITGEYEFDGSTAKWPRKRRVKWLMTGSELDLTKLNGGKNLDRKSVYPLDRIPADRILSLVPDSRELHVEDQPKPFVFVIDEINRGNISKIFGELITLIEDTKRGGMAEQASAILPYSGEVFQVPGNVYILGTMNTADRSIALMDTALRRRFRFVEMMPDAGVLRKIGADRVQDLDVAAMLEKINERITCLYDREHTIGHAFFTKLAQSPTLETLAAIFEKSVIPLLQEYFYEDYQKIQLVLGDNEKSDDRFKFIVDEEVRVRQVFKGRAEDVVDLPEKRYSVNPVALLNLNSYKEIL